MHQLQNRCPLIQNFATLLVIAGGAALAASHQSWTAPEPLSAMASMRGGSDSDGDGVPDSQDGCPNDPAKIAPGACGCGVPDTDTDGDGTADCDDSDDDNDGSDDSADGCPFDPAKSAPEQCGCGNPDTDNDNDGTADCAEVPLGMVAAWGNNVYGQCNIHQIWALAPPSRRLPGAPWSSSSTARSRRGATTVRASATSLGT